MQNRRHKKSHRSGSSDPCLSALKSGDLYGRSVGFTIKNGSTKYKSFTGALITILLLGVVGFFAVKRYTVMWAFEDTAYRSTILPDLNARRQVE